MQPERPQEVSALPSPAIFRGLATILALACGILLFAPEFLAIAAAHAGAHVDLPDWQIRAGAVAGLILAIVVHAASGGGNRPRVEAAFSDLALQTGGSYSVERMSVTPPVSEGGPTVRWTIQGIPVSLFRNRLESKTPTTRFAAELRLARPFQFVAFPRNGFTKFLSSPAMWSFVLDTAKKQAGTNGDSDREEGVEWMAFLAKPEVELPDPDLQAVVILKSDDEALALEYLCGAGVRGRVLGIQEAFRGGWQVSLLQADRAGNARLLVEFPGYGTRPEALRAGYDLMAAALSSLGDRELIRSGPSLPSAAA